MTSPITIDSNVLATMVARAVVEQLPEEQRTLLFQQAIEWIVTPRKRGSDWNAPVKSIVQEAFEEAVRKATYQIAEDVITGEVGEEVRERIRSAVRDVIAASLTEEGSSALRDTIQRQIAELISRVISESWR